MKKTFIQKILTSMLSMTLLLTLASCGDSGSTSTTTGGTTSTATQQESTTTPEATPDTTADADTTDSSDKVWVISTDTTYIPFEYTDSSGNFVGIDVDLLDAVAKDQGFEYDLQSLGWDAAVAAVQAGTADGIIAGASKTQARIDSGWLFSEGYYNATQTLIVHVDSDITSWEDLAGQNVAVKNGTAAMDFGLELAAEYGFTTTTFEDTPTMLQDVLMGNSVGCFEDTPVMAATIKEQGLDLKIPEGLHNEGADYAFAIMDEANMELLDMFEAGLANVVADGTYDAIIEKYFG